MIGADITHAAKSYQYPSLNRMQGDEMNSDWQASQASTSNPQIGTGYVKRSFLDSPSWILRGATMHVGTWVPLSRKEMVYLCGATSHSLLVVSKG